MTALRRSAPAAVCAVFCLCFSIPALAAPEDTTADAVTGQDDFTSNLVNKGDATDACSSCLQEPRGLIVDQNTGRLWVCDTLNNRVLSWPDGSAFENGEEADIVLGQDNFTDHAANKGNANPDERTLSAPRNCALDPDGRLFVADFGNFRILRYDPPIESNEEAVQVFGQPDFVTAVQNNGGTSANSLSNPNGVAVDSRGNLFSVDVNLHRLLIYNDPVNEDTTADFVIGQGAFNTNNANDPAGTPTDKGLNMPTGVAIDADDNVYIADSQNNRVLFYGRPFSDNMAATRVYGQADFTSDDDDDLDTRADTMHGPVALAFDPLTAHLFVADATNMRILEFDDPANSATANRVYGQGDDFTTSVVNKGGISADTLNDVAGVALDAKGNLYAADRINNRLLRFDAPPPVVPPVDTDDDGVADDDDNCPDDENADQADADTDGIGDVCDETPNPDCGNCGNMGAAMMIVTLVGMGLSRRSRPRRS